MKKRTRLEREQILDDRVKAMLEEMEKRHLTEGDAKEITERLKRALEINSERFNNEKPFAVFRYDD